MIRISENDMIFIPIITAIVNIFKSLGLKPKFAPVLSLVIGVIVAIFFSNEVEIKLRVLKGIFLGLSSSGVYTHGKGVIEVLDSKSSKKDKNNKLKN